MLAPTDRLVCSVAEAAHMLGISRAFAYELIAAGKLPHVRLGRRIVVPRRVIEAIVAVDADAVSE
ncbi:MAG: helix-turn-helix domain-containing protein [Acidimicrobiia bacterium]